MNHLADEILLFDGVTPVLNLETVGSVLQLMEELTRDGMTMVVVTHEMSFARKAANHMLFYGGRCFN